MSDQNEMSYPNIKQSWGIVGIAILSMVLFSPVSIFLNGITGEDFSLLAYYLLAMGATFLFAHLKRIKWTGVDVYNFDFGSGKMMLLVSIAVIAIQIGVISPLVSLVPIPEFMKKIFLELAGRTGVFSFIAVVIAAPVLEELIFRGIILDGLLKRYSPLKAIVMSSMFFGIVHLNPWQFIAALIIGIFSGWVYYRTKMLTLSIVIHFVNNLFAFGSMYFTDAEAMMDTSLIEQYDGILNLIMITAGATGVAVTCLYLLSLEMDKAEPDYGAAQDTVDVTSE